MATVADIILRDDRASQPAATAVGEGTIYYVTDENVTERSNGTTWEDISDGGGGSPSVGDLLDWQYVRKASGETVTGSDSLQNDDALLFAIGANETWEFEFVLSVSSSSDTPDIKVAITGPTACAGMWGSHGPASNYVSGTNVYNSFTKTVWDASSFAGHGIRNGVPVMVTIKGLARNGANAGNIQLQWAQNTSNGTGTTVDADSYLIARRVA
jgi:hypothetical protein